MLDLLYVCRNISPVLLLGFLHLGVEVPDAGLELFDFFPRVVVKIMDHVLFDLQHVSINFGLLEVLF